MTLNIIAWFMRHSKYITVCDDCGTQDRAYRRQLIHMTMNTQGSKYTGQCVLTRQDNIEYWMDNMTWRVDSRVTAIGATAQLHRSQFVSELGTSCAVFHMFLYVFLCLCDVLSLWRFAL